ncbi:Rv3235 family protein [Micropruina sp.]|uniref:Rv3235 family protein n=1 Tax=Micropruina sp. TaxID=2737536 RepID=UPI0039E21AAE
MTDATIRLIRAPLALAPAVRLVEPVLLQPVQEPLLPWPPAAQAASVLVEIEPRVQRIVGQLTAAVVEVLCGRRALEHLEPHLHPNAYQLVGHLRGAGCLTAVRLASLRLQQPAKQVIEASARLRHGPRSLAAALCFRCAPNAERWRLAELELAVDPAVVLRSG